MSRAHRVKIAEPAIGPEEEEAVLKVLRSKWIAYNPLIEKFERDFARFVGCKYGVSTANGTLALELMLMAAGVGPGDEILVPCFTFAATATAVLRVGAKPVFVDIELETYNIDPGKVLEAITPKTKAILAVHLYGHPADMKSLREIAEDHKLILLEDAAQAHGARAPEGPAGSLGLAAAFSFYATKNMTTGEGGMVTTNSEALARMARLIRDHGQEAKYLHVVLGTNYRMSGLQAALGLVQLKKLPQLNEKRRRNAAFLTSKLKPLGFITPVEKPGYYHVYHQYVVRVEKSRVGVTRDELASKLAERGIETAVHYPRALPDQPLFRALGYPPAELICPNAAYAARTVLSLPVHPLLTQEDLEYVVDAIKWAVEEG